MNTNIQDSVIEVIKKQINKEGVDYSPDTEFVKDLGLDSLDIVELVMEFENKFETSISDEEAQKMKNIGDVIQFISKQTSAKL